MRILTNFKGHTNLKITVQFYTCYIQKECVRIYVMIFGKENVFLIMNKYLKAFRNGFIIGTIIIALGIVVCMALLYPEYSKYTAEAKEAIAAGGEDIFYSSLTGYIYDDEGTVIKKIKKDKDSSYLKYEDIPKDVVNAFVAIEDRNFWTNPGIDIKGLIRVGIDYITSAGERKHGASTITQQLVRNIYISSEVTLERKFKEMCYALELTKRFTKKDIMEYYVNNIYYANGYYGIEAAAKGYFNKTADELTLSQTAYVCSIPNSPTYYDPVKNPENALKRRNKILDDMLEIGYVSQAAYNEAINEEIVLDTAAKHIENDSYGSSYAMDCVTKYLMQMNGFEFKYVFDSMTDYNTYLESYNEIYEAAYNEIYTSGYKIYTSLNSEKQRILQESIDNSLSFSEDKNENGLYDLQAGATCIDNETNKVVAIIGGRSQDEVSYLNRGYQSYRQPGSSIKPLVVYAPAIEMGYNANSQIVDMNIDTWKSTDAVSGSPIIFREAVERSKNGAAWGLMLEITPKKALSYLQNMKYAKIVPDDYYPSAALGGFTYGVTTVEMASGYSTLVNEGIYTEPTCIVSIIDKDGNEIYKESGNNQVYTKDASLQMIDILKGVITRGTAKSMGWSGDIEAAGKTGTTNDNKDGWFCGVTPYYSLAVWVGYDSPKELTGLYGSSYPAKIWNAAMKEFVSGLPAKSFEAVEIVDEGLSMEIVNEADSGTTASIDSIIASMYTINKADSNWGTYLGSMYDNAMIKVNQIQDENVRNAMAEKVEAAYNEVVNN